MMNQMFLNLEQGGGGGVNSCSFSSSLVMSSLGWPSSVGIDSMNTTTTNTSNSINNNDKDNKDEGAGSSSSMSFIMEWLLSPITDRKLYFLSSSFSVSSSAPQ